MKSLFILIALTLSRSLFASESDTIVIDPTGTYTLTGTTKKNQIIDHSGEIRVQLLDSQRIAICFYISKGSPGYESGFFMDTLPYYDNFARYTPPSDTDCTIVLHFYPKAVEIMQLYSDPTCTCGFKPGVMFAAYFKKSSSDKPVIGDFSTRGNTP